MENFSKTIVPFEKEHAFKNEYKEDVLLALSVLLMAIPWSHCTQRVFAMEMNIFY